MLHAARALVATFCLTLSLVLPDPARAVECTFCQGKTPKELIELSVSLESNAMRGQIRGYLAEKFPETASGLTARGWVASRNGAPVDEVVDLYMRAIAKDPRQQTAYVNAGYELDQAGRGAEAIALYEQGLPYTDGDPILVRNIFFVRKDAEGIQAAKRFLDKAEREGHLARWGKDFILAINARSDGKRAEADRHFSAALNKDGPFEVLEDLVDNRMRLLAAQRADRNARIDVIRMVIDWGYRNRSAPALELAADKLADLRLRDDAMRFYEEAFDMAPTPEPATSGYYELVSYQSDRALRLLRKAEQRFPDNDYVLRVLLDASHTAILDRDKIYDYGRRAIAAAPSEEHLRRAVGGFATALETLRDGKTAQDLFERHLPAMTGSNYNNLLGSYIDNRIGMGDFAKALSLVEEAETRDGFRESWLALRRQRAEVGLRLQTAKDDYYAANPFLLDWERRFGESLRVSVEFATGKADLRSSSFAVLDEAAEALKAAGAENYVFRVEGHTDITGSAETNLRLSRERAASVQAYLTGQAGIAPERLQTVGFGPRNPVASNETDDGRQKNRRVEIRPFGNLTAPRVATSSWLNLDGIWMSSDGRTAVTGYGPIQIWDLERQVLLHELPLGTTLSGAIAPNGRYFAAKSYFTDPSGGKTYNMMIYDLRTGLIHSQFESNHEIIEVRFSPFSDSVAWADLNGFLRVYDLSERKLNVTKVDIRRGIHKMHWMRDGKRILASAGRDYPVRVFDARTLQRIDSFDPPGWVHSYADSADGKYLVALNNDYEFVTMDARSFRVLNRKKVPFNSSRMRAHPTKPWVMVNSTFKNEIKLALVDMASGRVLASRRGDENLVGSFTPDGTQYVVPIDGRLAYLDLDRLEAEREITSKADRGRQVHRIPGTDKLISRDDGGTSVWSLSTGRRLHRLDVAVDRDWRALDEDGTVLVSTDKQGRLIAFDTARYTHRVVYDSGLEVVSLDIEGDHIVLGGEPDDDRPKVNPEGTVLVLDRKTFREVRRISHPLVTEPVKFREIWRTDITTVVSATGLVAVTSKFESGFSTGVENSRVATIYDIATGRELSSVAMDKRHTAIKWSEDGTELWFKDDVRWRIFDPKTGRQLRTQDPDFDYAETLADGSELTWFFDFMAYDGREITFPFSLRDVTVAEDLNLAAGITNGNEIVFVDLKQMQRALTISVKADGEWIAYTPEGEFTASLHGTEGVFWSLGDNFLPFEALQERYERPGLIRNRLEAIAAGKAAPDPAEQKPDVAADLFRAPYTLSLKSPAVSKTGDETFTLELSVEKDSADLPEPEIEYVLNGRRVLKSRGFDEDAFFDGAETVGITRKFDLSPGRNVIQASLVWKDARLMTQRVEVERTSQAGVKTQAAARTLWFFGVGVSDYEISSQNLNFAHRDAEELAKLAAEQQGVLFDKVNVLTLTNAEATERNVRIQMNEFLKEAAADDVVVMFLAGHGVMDDEQQLYFMTHDADMSRPYTGMSVDRFRQFLENRPLNQDALFLLDICHSGAAEGRVVADDAVQSLTQGTGAVVFASSSGSEKSLEDARFGGGHGAFTAALLDGLRGAADKTVGNRDGYNTLVEMVVFATSEVPRLTDGQQRPMFPRLGQSVDYALTEAAR